ncbi:Sodium/calcium exchanger 1 [Bagarius yarrelli]|uniref:Sodium/calcium exchanger 1 n=1 Tax=Bagarius yarrelli TaxID=175774 RepID=A0A556VUW2_BAGYA|nr:Sodium/calcium exchanger 1 [Bagarius yarrelli]
MLCFNISLSITFLLFSLSCTHSLFCHVLVPLQVSTEADGSLFNHGRMMKHSEVSSFLSTGIQCLAVVMTLLCSIHHVTAEKVQDHFSFDHSNKSGTCGGLVKCAPGVILPVWEPQNPSFGDKVARATVYFVALVYMFLGVSIIADRFMASIEVITSQEREITIKKPNGETTTTTVRIWNETVSNLTLMALGSSAPEILLSVIEVCGHNFDAGDLGPSTIVGSAAFNMFVIIGICVYVVPDGEHRKVKHLRVFFVTAAWSIFAYLWLYLILAVISPGVVQVWEGLLTLFFFPICVVFAWIADRRLLFYKYVYKRYRTGKHRGMIIETEGDRPLPSKVDIEMDGKMLNSHAVDFLDGTLTLDLDDKDLDEEEARRDMAKILKELKQKHPDKEMEQLIELANYQVLSQQQKSRAFYRCQATRLMTGAGNILKKHAADQARKAVSMHEVRSDILAVNVVRRGGDLNQTVSVEFRTEDGSANAGSDYEFTEGTVVFKPGETQKEIRVGIIDDDIFEEDENFHIHLSNLRIIHESDETEDTEANHVDTVATLGLPSTATVTIFDDDHAGIFTFEEPVMHVSESVGLMEVKVLRTSGARGVVTVPFKTIEGTAKGGGEDFEDCHGLLEFQNDEIFKVVKVRIIDDEEYEKNKSFFLELGEPQLIENPEKKGGDGGSGRGLEEVKNVKQEEAEPLKGEDDEERRIAEMGKPTLGEHVLFAFVPPTDYWNGWACFVVSIIMIGVLTAFIGDLASHFGCTVGLKDSVTAVVFVALGTSVPDTFASKVAAIQDQYADASIGNVTGSNAVNVFLGIGVAWSIAAIFHQSKGREFHVEPGNLAFSVTLFTIFAFICVAVLMYRRRPDIGGELGGPRTAKALTTMLFVSLWLIYILFSSLEAYCHIKGF